jgi:hypothetical protein
MVENLAPRIDTLKKEWIDIIDPGWGAQHTLVWRE